MKKLSLLFASIFLVGLMSCSNNEMQKSSASVEKNKESIKKVYAAFESGNTEGLENYIAENAVDHTPSPDMKSTGLAGIKETIQMQHAAFPDCKVEVISMIAEGDMVTAHFRMKGTNTGPMGAMPATNKTMDVNGVDVVRFENEKAVEHWGYIEEAKMMTQLGMMPPPNQNMAEGMHEGQEKK